MRKQVVAKAMEELRRASPDIEGCALVTLDGQIVAASLTPGVDPARVGALSIGAMKRGEEAAGGFGCGALEQLTLKAERGYVVIIRGAHDTALSIITGPSAKVGLVLQDAQRAVSSILAAQ